MSRFEDSSWSRPDYAQEYRETADHYIPDRAWLFHVMRSFARAHIPDLPTAAVCDIGCGDGVLAEQLLLECPTLAMTLVDGSDDMLSAAQARLADHRPVTTVRRSFQALVAQPDGLGPFDLVVSAFAIHHLNANERGQLFEALLDWLRPGGHFINIDIGLPGDPEATEWYYELWREWIRQHRNRNGVTENFDHIPEQARNNPDNQYAKLSDQLRDLFDTGFIEVGCHFRNGLFTLYSGRKPH